jgi:transposase
VLLQLKLEERSDRVSINLKEILMKKQRRHFAPTEKVAILKRHLLEKVPVSELCNELDIYPTQFYGWLKDFFENGHAAFENGRKAKAVEDAKDQKIQRLEAQLQRKNEVMAELLEEHTVLKKEFGEG